MWSSVSLLSLWAYLRGGRGVGTTESAAHVVARNKFFRRASLERRSDNKSVIIDCIWMFGCAHGKLRGYVSGSLRGT